MTGTGAGDERLSSLDHRHASAAADRSSMDAVAMPQRVARRRRRDRAADADADAAAADAGTAVQQPQPAASAGAVRPIPDRPGCGFE